MKNVRFCLTSLRKQVTQKLLTIRSSHWMLLAAVVGKTTEPMNFTKSSRKSWSLIRRLGAAQNPPRTSHLPVKADTITSHLLQAVTAPVNMKHKCRVQVEWQYFLRHTLDKSLPPAFTVDEIYQALQNMKAGTTPGYDHVHPEFLKNLGPRAQTWLSCVFSRIIIANAIPKICRKMKVIAIEKPGKDPDPRLAESYCRISMLRTCYKLLECLDIFHPLPLHLESRIVEGLADS